MGYLGGLHYYWPMISGRMYPESWASCRGDRLRRFNLTFFPQFVLAFWACRGATTNTGRVPGLQRDVHGGASILGLGYLIPLIYFLWSMWWASVRRSTRGGDDAGLDRAAAAAAGELRQDADRDSDRTTTPERRPSLASHTHSEEHAHSPNLAHQFRFAAPAARTSTLGMWMFWHEIMFFAGLSPFTP